MTRASATNRVEDILKYVWDGRAIVQIADLSIPFEDAAMRLVTLIHDGAGRAEVHSELNRLSGTNGLPVVHAKHSENVSIQICEACRNLEA